jgi:Casein kinase II regulatory subunit
VTEDFIEDDFNLTGLNTMVPFWKEAMDMVLDVEPGVGFRTTFGSYEPTSYVTDEDASKIPDVSIVESSAEMLYGLVHQRYILTRAGLQAMVRSRFISLPILLECSRTTAVMYLRLTSMRAGCLVPARACTA